MQLCGVQFDIQWEDKAANFARVRELLRAALPAPGALVVLPELFATGFSMNVAAVAEGDDSPTERFLIEVAGEFDCCLLGGLARTHGGTVGNEAAAVSTNGILARYRKIHPFSLGGEAQHYAAGHEIALFDWQGWRVAPLICYDLRFPETFRAAARCGANLFCVIANWPVARIGHWVTLLQARAIENQAWVVGVNRCGEDPHLKYSGRSLVVDPHGAIVADAGDAPTVISATADLEFLENYRRDFPALADMRNS